MALDTILAGQRLVAIDVGARGGIPEHWQRFAGHLDVHGFEPDAAACAEAQRTAPPGITYHPAALGRRDGPARLYVTRVPSGSSLYPPNLEFFREYHGADHMAVEKVVPLRTVSLASFRKRAGLDRIDALKLDVQGAELDVLRGAGPGLRDALAVETEVEFAELYRGQPRFCDVERHLEANGFDLFDLRTHRVYKTRDGERDHYLRTFFGVAESSRHLSARLVAGDALYFRRIERWPGRGNAEATARVRRWIALLCVYGYLDVAVDAVERLRAAGAVAGPEADAMLAEVRRLFPGRRLVEADHWLGRQLRRAGRRLHWFDKRVFWTRRQFPNQ